ncbi:MAG: glutamine--tRNA ligase/YqeY domain fusion protein [Gammaproteobacteria bacterium]|nr:glutamine--tRNA ligase/YqeY domain fusion protein [Gammaproteobacteria bacterium]
MSSSVSDFIRNRIRDDIENEIVDGSIVTRFPPEPNGYLHIGHAKSICLNFGVAEEFGGQTYLRFDDTNPLKESAEFVESIQRDVRWLGFDWGDRLTFASDYFDQLYGFAEQLIEKGRAYVCDLSADEIRATRGTLTEPGSNSPYRDRTVTENLNLFRRMRAGEFDEGSRVLRAKIDMESPNIHLRDPVLYRIVHAEHHRTGEKWCIYPMYDFTHCICDALEGITHSLCTLEFEDNRPLYDWVLDNVSINFHPPQIEFSRLGLEFNVMSKRILTSLISDGHVEGWDDPRLPTISGLRRRGVPPEAIRDFCGRVGVTKQANLIETSLLDFCVRSALEDTSPRAMAVIDPLPVTVINFERDDVTLEAPNHPKVPELGTRELTFGRNLFIERSDFRESASKKQRKLTLNGLARLRYGFIVECVDVVTDDQGSAIELKVRYVPESQSGQDTSGLKPRSTLHWISAANAVPAKFRLFEHLFNVREPGGGDLGDELNPTSKIEKDGLVERVVIDDVWERCQFERNGYFVKDSDSTPAEPVFNRIVPLSSGVR